MKSIKIPLNRPTLTSNDIAYLKKSLNTGLFSGNAVKDFELKIAGYTSRKYAVATGSGTSALHLSLLSLRIKEGDEVICPSYTCVALLNAVNYLKARPKPVDCNFDVERGDFNISLPDLKRKITGKTKAIIVPHMYGYPAEIDKISGLGIPVIEDATQSFGGNYRNKRLGSYGEISIFSFHNSKMITTGEGGVLLTDSRKLFENARFLSDYEATLISQRLKSAPDYHVQYNYKMSDLNAHIGISQLSRISQFIRRRREIARFFTESLKDAFHEVPMHFKGHNFWRYAVRVKKDPRRIIKEAMKHGIELGRGVYPPIHQYLKMDDRLFPNTKKAVSSLVVIPLYPSLTEGETRYITKVLRGIV